tara:strand:- start:452 stop:1408 length:957 start_codon:yes stop_codon:yes gene_type:complete
MKPRFHIHPGVGWAATTPFYFTLQHLNRYCTTGMTKEMQYWALAHREGTSDFDRYREKNIADALYNKGICPSDNIRPPLADNLQKIFTKSWLEEWYSPPFSIDKYLSYYILLNENKEDYKSVGDFSTWNVDIPEDFLHKISQKLLEHFDVKVTITFSDPITRFYYEVGRLCGLKTHGILAALGKQQKLFKSFIDRKKFESTTFDRNNTEYAQTYTKYCNAFGKENVLPIIMEEFWEPSQEKEQRERLSTFIGYQIDKIHPNFFWPLSQTENFELFDQSQSLYEPLTPELIEYAREPMRQFYDDWIKMLPMPSTWNYKP